VDKQEHADPTPLTYEQAQARARQLCAIARSVISKRCPSCRAWMNPGAPHSPGVAFQWECDRCGHVIPIGIEPPGE